MLRRYVGQDVGRQIQEDRAMDSRRRPPRRVRRVRYRDTDEWPIILAQAAAEGISPGTYIREASIREARREIGAANRHPGVER
jgi:hypothetical protein